MDFPEEPRVDTLGDAGAALEPVLTDQHRSVRRENVHLHIVEMEFAAPFR